MNFETRRQLALEAASKVSRIRARCKISLTSVISPTDIAEKRGCEVWFQSLPTLEGVYSPAPRPVIIIGSERPAGRKNFNIAHELGHHEFKHGMRIEELNSRKYEETKDPNEFLADMFAAYLLMPPLGIKKALKDRSLSPDSFSPEETLRLSSYFGVGYSTILTHLTYSLKLLSIDKFKSLEQSQPKKLKAKFGGKSDSEVILVDVFWQHRAVDMEIGDLLVLPSDAKVSDNRRLQRSGMVGNQLVYQATASGYARAFLSLPEWAVNIRISKKNYSGLARYRFFDGQEEN